MERVAVFLDYQNVHLTAHGLYANPGVPVYRSLVHPMRLAERIVGKRRDGGEVHQVRVFRGRPNPEHDPVPTAANDAQTAAWQRDPRVTITRRDLNYRGWPDNPPREKGVNVALAIDLVQSALADEYDVAVVFTADTDLLPAIEMAFYKTAPRIEIAAWSGQKPLWFPKELQAQRRLPWCHFLSEEDFQAVKDHHDYLP